MPSRSVVVSVNEDTSPEMASWIQELAEPFDSVRVVESGSQPDDRLPLVTARADLVVMDARRTAEGNRAVEAVVDSGPAEILVASHWPHDHHAPVAVLVLDLARDAKVIETAFSLAESLQTQLNVIHHWTVEYPEFFVYEEIARQRQLDDVMASWRDKYPSVAVTVEMLFGPWSDAVMRVEAYPLLVMGRPVNRHDRIVDNVLSLRDLPVLLVPVTELPTRPHVRTEAESRAAHPSGKGRAHLRLVK